MHLVGYIKYIMFTYTLQPQGPCHSFLVFSDIRYTCTEDLHYPTIRYPFPSLHGIGVLKNCTSEILHSTGVHRGTLLVAQLVEALLYKPEGRGFDSRWRHWNFTSTYSFWPHYGPGVDSASNRNAYQEYFLRGKGGRCVRLTTLPPSCVDCFEIW